MFGCFHGPFLLCCQPQPVSLCLVASLLVLRHLQSALTTPALLVRRHRQTCRHHDRNTSQDNHWPTAQARCEPDPTRQNAIKRLCNVQCSSTQLQLAHGLGSAVLPPLVGGGGADPTTHTCGHECVGSTYKLRQLPTANPP
jgi:hypothetical protein